MRQELIVSILAASALTASAETVERVESPLHLDGWLTVTDADPLGATVDLGPNATLVFEALLPCEVPPSTLELVTVAGRAFDPEVDRLSIYGNGSEIIPDGWADPLTVYKGENCSGESMVLQRDIYYRGTKINDKLSYLPQELMGSFDNAVRSFRLKRGFRVCFANNNDGTGYSRVFTATDTDLVVESMPEGLEFASFIRVSRADRVGKRGIAGDQVGRLTHASWAYNWAASTAYDGFEFVPMRHNKWWDGWEVIGRQVETADVLAYNEPDHAEQSDLGPDYAISEWDNFMASGLRVGSPAPDQIRKDWLTKFLATADSLNYRVDFVATHMYWDSQDPQRLADEIDRLCTELYSGRPMWITEWNNGANWTHEWWPDATGEARDADFNIVKARDGSDSIVSRPHTEANSARQCEWLAKALQAFDGSRYLERHSIFSWVEDARGVELGGRLTPAGRLFAAHRSVPGFDHSREYEHRWRIAPPFLSRFDVYDDHIVIHFTDHNGETGVNYIVEERAPSSEWRRIALLEAGRDYKVGKTVRFKHYFTQTGTLKYRVRATSYKGEESINSRVHTAVAEVAGITDPEVSLGLDIRTAPGMLLASSADPCELPLYLPDGRCMTVLRLTPEEQSFPLEPGIYILASSKVVIR